MISPSTTIQNEPVFTLQTQSVEDNTFLPKGNSLILSNLSEADIKELTGKLAPDTLLVGSETTLSISL